MPTFFPIPPTWLFERFENLKISIHNSFWSKNLHILLMSTSHLTTDNTLCLHFWIIFAVVYIAKSMALSVKVRWLQRIFLMSRPFDGKHLKYCPSGVALYLTPSLFREMFECNGSFYKDVMVKIVIWLWKIAISRTTTKILTESKTLSQWLSINTSMILKGKITRKYNFSNNANIRRQQCLRIQFAKQLYMSEIKTNIQKQD